MVGGGTSAGCAAAGVSGEAGVVAEGGAGVYAGAQWPAKAIDPISDRAVMRAQCRSEELMESQSSPLDMNGVRIFIRMLLLVL